MAAVFYRMKPAAASTDHQIGTITVDDLKYFVSLRVIHDGVEHVGRLRFTDTSSEISYQDHGGIPGITVADAVRRVKEFSEAELKQRCYRALSEKRRFGKLRNATDKMIAKIKHLNRIAIGLEKGLIDPDGGKLELDQTESDLLEIVKTLKLHAGVEDEPE